VNTLYIFVEILPGINRTSGNEISPSSIALLKQRKEDIEDLHLKEKWRNKDSTGVKLDLDKLAQVGPIQPVPEDPLLKNHSHRPLHYHALIIPVRDREQHLQEFQRLINPYIEQNYKESEFSLWVIEQDDTEAFNKGWLMNVGIAEIIRHTPEVECVSMNDVDFVPDMNTASDKVQGRVYYDKCIMPTGTASELERANWSVPYPQYVGGVVTMHLEHWRAINGFSNHYVSWGVEDDDLFIRLLKRKLLTVRSQRESLIFRPPKGMGRFREIGRAGGINHIQDQSKANYLHNLKLLNLTRDFPRRSEVDGLSDLQYMITSHRIIRRKSGFAQTRYIKAKQQLLELVDIPDTRSDFAIEKAAAVIGIPWGICHLSTEIDDLNCPAPPNFRNAGLEYHHGNSPRKHPPHLWNINMFQGRHTFAVIRNPFTRLISSFENGKNDPSEKQLNKFVHFTLCQKKGTMDNAPIQQQQHYYTDYNHTRQVMHILRYETLTSEFLELMGHYDLPIQITATSDSSETLLGIQNLTVHSIELIQKYFTEDFRLFNYSSILYLEEAATMENLCARSRGLPFL
jgi:hypothetical protein